MTQQKDPSDSADLPEEEAVEGELVEPESVDPSAENASDETNESETETAPLTIEEQLAAALEEVAKQKDAALRAVAEQENFRRRSQRDVQNAHKFGAEKLLRELLTVADNLEMALLNDEAGSEGVKMTLDQLLQVFEKNNVVALEPMGEQFNPELHQAMTMQPSDEVEPNHVMQVVQKGYQLHERLLRPAMVIVAKAAEDDAAG
ncbi:MAG: nucleotide exchange factor GrpE [Immundisolibacteraceae bacterium]|nr:nucleotide exchange factor GrpE [Immundisolibacteraceae bacterium]